MATRFVADLAASPFGIHLARERQVGEGVSPTLDAVPNMGTTSRFFKGRRQNYFRRLHFCDGSATCVVSPKADARLGGNLDTLIRLHLVGRPVARPADASGWNARRKHAFDEGHLEHLGFRTGERIEMRKERRQQRE